MESESAVNTLAALAQQSRLGVFRLLVRSGKAGMAAGDIARKTKILPNTLSAHLTVLGNAGLVQSRRQSRSIIYQADFERMRELLDFLMADCCNGSPEICAPLGVSAKRHSGRNSMQRKRRRK